MWKTNEKKIYLSSSHRTVFGFENRQEENIQVFLIIEIKMSFFLLSAIFDLYLKDENGVSLKRSPFFWLKYKEIRIAHKEKNCFPKV